MKVPSGFAQRKNKRAKNKGKDEVFHLIWEQATQSVAVLGAVEEVENANAIGQRGKAQSVTANHVVAEKSLPKPEDKAEQLDLFTDYESVEQEREQAEKEEKKEKALQHAMIAIKEKFGKNAILKGTNLEQGAMTIERNQQVGGHHE